jgi:hypothetical protein
MKPDTLNKLSLILLGMSLGAILILLVLNNLT